MHAFAARARIIYPVTASCLLSCTRRHELYVLSSQAGALKYVLRKKPPGKVLASAHAVDREFRIISALAARSEVRATSHFDMLIWDDVATGPAC